MSSIYFRFTKLEEKLLGSMNFYSEKPYNIRVSEATSGFFQLFH